MIIEYENTSYYLNELNVIYYSIFKHHNNKACAVSIYLEGKESPIYVDAKIDEALTKLTNRLDELVAAKDNEVFKLNSPYNQ